MLALRRTAAFGIDWCLFILWASVVALVSWYSQDGDLAWPSNPWVAQAIGSSLVTLPFVLYFALLESSRRQATVGKRVLGLRVVSSSVGMADGQRISRGSAFGRAVIKLLPWEIGHVFAHQIGALPAGTDAEVPVWLWASALVGMGGSFWYFVSIWVGSGRTPYDRLAGTRVERNGQRGSVSHQTDRIT